MTTAAGLAAPDKDAPLSPLIWLILASLLAAGLAWYWFSSYAWPERTPGCLATSPGMAALRSRASPSGASGEMARTGQ
ncbi:hypothetical protein [Janthinobacterium sp. 75]|uniref:hypothetical protein n=1 Tax=Janthinobacterium sp. 75 TaxID=2135628 RepID=UPI00106299D7|nr:hypothetical protein [Janthinobacterium sp. 75]